MNVPCCEECGALGSAHDLIAVPEPTGFYYLCGECWSAIETGWAQVQSALVGVL